MRLLGMPVGMGVLVDTSVAKSRCSERPIGKPVIGDVHVVMSLGSSCSTVSLLDTPIGM